MKLFFKKIICLSLILGLILLAFIILPTPSSIEALAKNKYDLMEKSKDEAKIILVGGSNVLYGLSAEQIEKATGQKTINLGINGGFGLKYDINQVKPYVKKGDTVILSPEYDNFSGGWNGGAILLIMYNSLPESRTFIDNKQFVYYLKEYGLLFFQLKLGYLVDWVFGKAVKSQDEINSNGDILIKDASRNISTMEYYYRFSEDNYNECLSVLKDFKTFCQKEGISLYIAPPTLPTIQYEKNRRDIEILYNRLKNDMEILYEPSVMKFEPEYFLDTVYHLNDKGRKMRTDITSFYLRNCK